MKTEEEAMKAKATPMSKFKDCIVPEDQQKMVRGGDGSSEEPDWIGEEDMVDG